MKGLLLIALLALACPMLGRAQFGSFTDVPVEVDADGETRFENGVAVAEDNVVIRYGNTSIYSDYAQYSPDTRDVFVRGNVRIYREGRVFAGERAIYNLETKQLRTADIRGAEYPYAFSAESIFTLGGQEIKATDAIFTTSDSSKPDYFLKAKGVRIYPDDRIIFTGVKLYVGQTPIFYFPYLYQSLDKDAAFTLSPGYSSRWGAFLLTKYTFPISENIAGEFRFDLRSQRGVGVGLGADFELPKTETASIKDHSYGTFRAYYAADSNPDKNFTGLPRNQTDTGRYRIAFQSKIFVTDDIYATIDLNKLSDSKFLEDFEPGLYSNDPQPDNLLALTKWNENYTVTGILRARLNDFQGATERLPEVVLDTKRQPLFKTPLFYQGTTGFANLTRGFEQNDQSLPDYDALRFDTFHQISYPRTYGNWLSVIPRAGARGTYYSDSGSLRTTTITTNDGITTTTREARSIDQGGSLIRGVANAGLEASFKFWKEYEEVQSRRWGLDGLRHVVQPYTEFSATYSSQDSNAILQFDRYIPSTELPPNSYPEFNSVDSISAGTVWRWGVRNRFQTRRDNRTFSWLQTDTYFNLYIDNPEYAGITSDEGNFSNIFNRLRWDPVPWMSLSFDTQLPLLDAGFTEINTMASVMLNRDLRMSLGHRYLEGNPLFRDSNQITLGVYYQVNDNWAFSLRERYEINEGRLESQLYELHRDLSSWVASAGLVLRDNGNGRNEFGFLLSFTLKDLPNVTLPLNLDPQSQGLPLRGSR